MTVCDCVRGPNGNITGVRAACPTHDPQSLPWPRVRQLVGADLEALLEVSGGTAELAIHLDFRDGELVKASAGGKLAGRRP